MYYFILNYIIFSGYQKGIVPKYLRERKEQGSKEIEGAKTDDSSGCPPGHVPLPDTERKETLRMLRNSLYLLFINVSPNNVTEQLIVVRALYLYYRTLVVAQTNNITSNSIARQ